MTPKPQQDSVVPSAAKKSGATKANEMSPDLLEFIRAIDDYKRLNERPFPSWGEILDIVHDLGYCKLGPDSGIH